jgi:nicotinate-nucleotide adenylyltransferase
LILWESILTMNRLTCRSLLVFGGTFDQPHVAHIALPLLAAQKIGAEHVAFVPAAQSPLKIEQAQTPAFHRLNMLRLALADVPQALILMDELDRAKRQPRKPSYTVDTLANLRLRLPVEARLYLLIGADQVRLFHRWHQFDRIGALAEPIAMLRPPDDPDTLLKTLPRKQDRLYWSKRLVMLPQIDVSSSWIRQCLAQGESVTGFVPPAVLDYIRRNKLYGTHG